MIRPAHALVALLSLLTVACATQPRTRPDPRDPWERFNRASFAFNDALDRAVVRPVAKGYRKVAPHFVERGVSNFFDNLEQPTIIVSELLQAKFRPAASDTARLLLNTTVGIGGLFDPATAVGLDKNDEDLGQAFGKWGIPSGPYLVVPFFGPSTLRDGIGSVGEVYTDPVHYVERDKVRYGIWTIRLIDTRARLLDIDQTIRSAFDPYSFVRNAYLQRREYQVKDGAVEPPTFEDEELEDEDLPEEPADGPEGK